MIATLSTGLLSSPVLHTLTDVLDWVGTLVFAASGALIGVQKRFDLFGVLFLAFVVAVVGGMARDVLIGAVPPVAITDITYFLISVAGGLIIFRWYPRIVALQRPILLFDAVGLSLFAVTGTEKAIEYGINPVMAALLGMITGIGGGMTRDVLAGDVPFVLRGDLYALAALAAGATVSLGHAFAITPLAPMLLGGGICVFLRLMAIYRGWRAPVARWGGNGPR